LITPREFWIDIATIITALYCYDSSRCNDPIDQGVDVKKDQNKHNPRQTKKLVIVTAVALFVIAVVIGLFLAMQPQRTVANFCKVAKEEKSTLVGNVNYEKRLETYKKLEVVSPDDIRPDITTIRKGYEEIVKNPSSTINTGLGMSGAENRRTAFIDANCKDF
jgi:hypothetical protein